jgi:hypothetical protein
MARVLTKKCQCLLQKTVTGAHLHLWKCAERGKPRQAATGPSVSREKVGDGERIPLALAACSARLEVEVR